MNHDGELLSISVVYLLAAVIYVIPSWVAFHRGHPNRWAILAVNLAFGATGLGWIGSLVWALHRVHLPADPSQSRGGQSGLNLFVNDPRLVHVVDRTSASRWGSGRDAGWAVSKLEELNRLRDAGHLTAEEHARLKAEILAALA